MYTKNGVQLFSFIETALKKKAKSFHVLGGRPENIHRTYSRYRLMYKTKPAQLFLKPLKIFIVK